MIEIDFEGTILKGLFENHNAKELEELIHENILENLKEQIDKQLDEMSFIDIEPDGDKGDFKYTASLVLCSKQNIISNAEVMAQKLAKIGVLEPDILDVLSTMENDLKGF